MDVKGLLLASKKADPNAKTYQLRTDFKYDGLREYPRPQLQRSSYINLNGLWDFSIKDKSGSILEEGQILVPFSPECQLSGTDGYVVRAGDILEYKRLFNLKKIKGKKRLILHFGAVDQVALLSINGQEVGTHAGGYTAFSFDITDFVQEGDNELTLLVADGLDERGLARGKQSLQPEGMWYQAQSGIWQTVWMEWVPKAHVKSIRTICHTDRNSIELDMEVSKVKEEVDMTSTSPGLIKSIKRLEAQEGHVSLSKGYFWDSLSDCLR